MARRGENIRKRKDNRWEGRYKYTLSKDGKWKYRSVYGKTYSEVKEKLYAKRNETNHTLNQKAGNDRFSNILIMWLKSIKVRIKPSTESKYQYMIEKHIIPTLGGYRMSELNSTIINSFLDMKLTNGRLNGNGGLSPSYVQTISVLIVSALQFAAQENFCLPIKSPIHKPSLPKQKLVILSCDELKQLEKVLFENIDEIKLGILIALSTGMRIGEICALMWSDIEFNNKIIHVNHTLTRVRCEENSTGMLIIGNPKTKSSLREIPIPDFLMPILENVHSTANSIYVVSKKNGFMSTRTFDYKYKQVLKNAGVSAVNFHSLRHTFATNCVNAGVDIKTLSEILGHANVAITLNTYVHPSMEMKKLQLEKLYANGSHNMWSNSWS